MQAGDLMLGNKSTRMDQCQQRSHGPQTNIAGDAAGPVLSGEFGFPVAVGGGEAVDQRGEVADE